MNQKKKSKPKTPCKENPGPPEILYKYVTLESIESILEGSSLKFANPIGFNDPFDCNIPLFDIDTKSIMDLIKAEVLRTLNIDRKSEQYIDFTKNKNLFTGEMEKLKEVILEESRSIINDWIEILNKFRILSLTTTPDNILMWSHYADYHKGVVLGFKSNSTLGKAEKVNYDEGENLLNRFLENMLKVFIQAEIKGENTEKITDTVSQQTIKVFFRYFLLKKKEWSYENEYRIIKELTDSTIKRIESSNIEVVKFDKQDLRSVTFGIETPEEKIISIRRLLADNYGHTSINQAYKDGWNLNIRSI